MADERDFELLDDYLGNRMNEQDRAAFEQKMNADPHLQQEYALQQRVIQGIKDARAAELKAMLNNVPVPSGNTGSALTSKIMLGAAVSLMIAAGAWFFIKDSETGTEEIKAHTEQPIPDEKQAPQVLPKQPVEKETPAPVERKTAETDKNQTSAGTEQRKPSLAKRPEPLSAPANKTDKRTAGSLLLVEVEETDNEHSFHYQLSNGKLSLFGPFEKGLYEVIELDSGVYLSYRNSIYQLKATGSEIKPLTPVTDSTLIRKLVP